jgi:hypothetical protein
VSVCFVAIGLCSEPIEPQDRKNISRVPLFFKAGYQSTKARVGPDFQITGEAGRSTEN